MALPDPAYYYPSVRAWDPTTSTYVPSAVVSWYAEGDTAFATPLEVWDFAGVSQGTSITATSYGDVPPYVLGVPSAVAKAGSWSTTVASHRGLREAVEAARDAAVAAEAAAVAAVTAAGGFSGIAGAPESWPSTFPPTPHAHELADLRRIDGVSLLEPHVISFLTSGDTQAARVAIGAGTGSGTGGGLTLGTTSTTAAPGDHTHPQYLTDAQVQAKIDASFTSAGAAPSGSVFSRRYASGAYPVRGTLPAGAVVMWIGPVHPPIGGSYFIDGTDVHVGTP